MKRSAGPFGFEFVPGETFLSSPTALVVALVLYVVIWTRLSKAYGIAPRGTSDPAILARREFYKPILLFHNAFLSLWSIVMFGGLLFAYFSQFLEETSLATLFTTIVCDQNYRVWQKLQFWLYIFYISKIYEFGDTFLLCFTMRKVIPLHWIHHILTLVITWGGMYSTHSVMAIAMLFNTGVHVIMYAYYAYRIVNPNYFAWWKKYLTTIQMVQFVLNLIGLAIWTYMEYSLGMDCAGEAWLAVAVFLVMVIFLALFAAFAKKTYCKKLKHGTDAVGQG